eukprot:1161075-Pelagomonas_calceolata.AAC.25
MHKRRKLCSTSSYYYNSWQRLNYAVQPTPPNTTQAVNSEAHGPLSQLANKEIRKSFWNNSKIALGYQINVLKYYKGTVYTQIMP